MRAAESIMMNNRLQSLQGSGQSIWLDMLSRKLIVSGELKRLIREDWVSGLTSNPAIFAQAISDGTGYEDILEASASRALDAKALYERIAVRDIQDAADALASVYETSDCRDGFVSLEVSPLLARDTEGTVVEARRLWAAVSRANLMVKVPGTAEGIVAFRRLIGERINVNVTLLFASKVYEQVADAYLAGLESIEPPRCDLAKVASVASIFVSRVDTAVDRAIGMRADLLRNPREQAVLRSLRGKVAIANAKIAYQRYLESLHTDRWRTLSRRGAQSQRLLWASTGTKNPDYRDVLYIEELIGPDTVNTMPPASLVAFRDHGIARLSLTENLDEARSILDALGEAGIALKDITDQLLVEGVQQFSEAFERVLKATGGDGVKATDRRDLKAKGLTTSTAKKPRKMVSTS